MSVAGVPIGPADTLRRYNPGNNVQIRDSVRPTPERASGARIRAAAVGADPIPSGRETARESAQTTQQRVTYERLRFFSGSVRRMRVRTAVRGRVFFWCIWV